MPNSLNKIETPNAPKAIGPYSQAISVPAGQTLLFVSGQLPMDPQTGELITGDIKTQTKRVIDNLEAILKAAKTSLQNVVRTDIFLTDLKRDFAAMNEEYGKRFSFTPSPARQTVQVAALPKGAEIEISCIAIVR